MLAYNEKNDVIVCVRGQFLSYAVLKNAAAQHLGRATKKGGSSAALWVATLEKRLREAESNSRGARALF
jgi:hypothetical protein